MSIKEGSKVRVKPEVRNPSCGWGLVKHGEVGVVKAVGAFGDLTVDFPRHKFWAGHTREMELVVDTPTAITGLTTRAITEPEVIVNKPKRKSPEKVLAYGIMQKGLLHKVEFDRDVAREIKFELGGKKEGVTIVVLTAGKEIR